MKLKPNFKGLKYFLLRSKASRLYREYLKEIYRVPNPELREEYLTELRNEFTNFQDLENEKVWDYLLAEGRQKLPLIKEMINRVL